MVPVLLPSFWSLWDAGEFRSDELLLNVGVLPSKCCWYPSDGLLASPVRPIRVWSVSKLLGFRCEGLTEAEYNLGSGRTLDPGIINLRHLRFFHELEV